MAAGGLAAFGARSCRYPRPHVRFGFGRENLPLALERFETFLAECVR